jgi:GT2 family glycosyltransferase
MIETEFHPLQSLLWPEPGISTERSLYMRLKGPAALSMSGRRLSFGPGGSAGFDTAMNLFNLGKWQHHCGLADLRLRLEGRGRFELAVIQSPARRSPERLVNEIVELTPERPLLLELKGLLLADPKSAVFFTLLALGEGELTGAVWETADAPKRLPQLALAITTFRREAAVAASVARFNAFMAESALAPHLHLFVVDNGRSAEIEATAHVTPIGNENLGGSGGFARGLLAAEARDATHCLFMDDDASVHMGALERTWAFLAYAGDPRTAVAGGMTMANDRWTLWESGAIFRQNCKPQWLGTDLRDLNQVLEMEQGSTGPKPPDFYGGWWYFAFPVAHATYRPFPFFVRGDDVSFSLANDFDIVTLPGVLCFQDADFSDKETLQTLYLDLRSHLVHHLALPAMDIGRVATLKIPAWFFLRSMMQCHYETLAALNLALADVLRGPDFFAANADMAERRARIGRMRDIEGWKPLPDGPPPSRRRFDPRRNRFWRMVMKYSLNGHLLPFFGLWGNHVTLEAGQRGQLHEVWGAARITYVSGDGTQGFTVRHSKRAALGQGLRMVQGGLRLAAGYGALKRRWREGYPRLASTAFWKERLGL